MQRMPRVSRPAFRLGTRLLLAPAPVTFATKLLQKLEIGFLIVGTHWRYLKLASGHARWLSHGSLNSRTYS